MAYLILVAGGANRVAYKLTAYQRLAIEAVSVDVDVTAASTTSYVDVIFADQAGLLAGRSRSSTSLIAGDLYEMTFAPDLPDSNEIGNAFGTLAYTTGLVATVLPPQATVTVQVSDPAGIVKQVRIWAENVDDDEAKSAAETDQFGPWAYVLGPGA